MIAENFNSPSVEAHYASAQKQAIAFLFTTGAKALVIAEQKSFSEDAFIGANAEAVLKQEIVNEERVKLIKRKLAEGNPIAVFKNSRNGKLRCIHLKVKHDLKHHAFFSWKSKNNIKKHFLLDRQTTVEPLTEKPIDSVLSFYPNSNSGTNYNHQPNAADHASLPFLRFRNSDRVLDIRFSSVHEMEACLELIHIFPGENWHSFTSVPAQSHKHS